MQRRILVVDDDRLIRELLADALRDEGFEVALAASGDAALRELAQGVCFDLLLTDLSMRGMDGLELLERIKREHPQTDVVILTGYASVESALRALRLGAADYLLKPVKPPEIVYCVERVMLRRKLLEENESLRECVQAFEASRVLTSCTETVDVLPMAMDILLRLLDRTRAVGRLVNLSPQSSDGIYLRGFADPQAVLLREQIERGKLFEPLGIEGPDRGIGSSPELLTSLEIEGHGVLALALRFEGRLIGAIWVFDADEPFGEAERRAADLVVAQTELAMANAERFLHAREKAFIDDVTDLYNARYLFSALDREVTRAGRAQTSVSVLFLDLDRFKQVNDCHGHLVGSRVLRELGQLFQASVRSIDIVGRYGGDEFTIVLVDTEHPAALQVAERIRQLVEETSFGSPSGVKLSLTVSIGVATLLQHGSDRERLLDQSDKAMYLGKSLGRNRVCSADELSDGSV
jgi:diguanylate cyclase (GGDEF)-like protein